MLPSGASVKRTRDASFSQRVVYSGMLKVKLSTAFGGSVVVSLFMFVHSLSDLESFVLVWRDFDFDFNLSLLGRVLEPLALFPDLRAGSASSERRIMPGISTSIVRASPLFEDVSSWFTESPKTIMPLGRSDMASELYVSFTSLGNECLLLGVVEDKLGLRQVLDDRHHAAARQNPRTFTKTCDR